MKRSIITGLEKVLSNLNKEIEKIEGRTEAGFIRASIIIQRDMEKTPPLTPVDTGNLRASFFRMTPSMAKRGIRPSTPQFSDIGHDGTVRKGAAQEASMDYEMIMSEVIAELVMMTFPMIYIGYTARYATAVHENMEAKNWSRPNSGPKFLEQSVYRNQEAILQVIREEAKIK